MDKLQVVFGDKLTGDKVFNLRQVEFGTVLRGRMGDLESRLYLITGEGAVDLQHPGNVWPFDNKRMEEFKGHIVEAILTVYEKE